VRFHSVLEGPISDHDLVVVTHGTVMAAWLQLSGLVENGFAFWSELRQPDAWEVDLARRRAWRFA
jgi:hypothetical protein